MNRVLILVSEIIIAIIVFGILLSFVFESMSACRDFDDGNKFYSKSMVASAKGPVSDYCIDENRLAEYYCSGEEPVPTEFTCPNGCNNGACKPN